MENDLSLARLNEILQAIRPLRLGVVGDCRLSGRWYIDPEQPSISPFTGTVVRERYFCGGAANVAANLAVLGLAGVPVFGVLGEDWRSAWLRQALSKAGVGLSGVLLDPGWATPFSALMKGPGEQQAYTRVNFLNTAELSLDAEEQLLTRLESALPDLDALVVMDGNPAGVITPGVLEGLNEMAAGAGRMVFTVSSGERTGQFANMVRVVNQVEAARWLFPDREPGAVGLPEFAEAALYPQVDCGCPLFITLGEQGCLVLEGGESHIVSAPDAAPIGTAEAGETFLAALTAALAAGASPLESARLGQLSVTAVARHPDERGAPSPVEILEVYAGNLPAVS